METNNATGRLVSEQDVREAISAVETAMVTLIMKLPPRIAVQLPNIRRCLQELLVMKNGGK